MWYQVVYDIEGFLEKNNDSLHDNLLDLLDTTEDPFLRSVIDFVDPEAGSESRLERDGVQLRRYVTYA